MEIVHFGAGNIGRGFIGQVLNENHAQVHFVDVNEQIIKQINQDGGYDIEYIDEHSSRYTITNVKAYNILKDEDKIIELISKCDKVTTSLGINNISKIVDLLASGLSKNKQVVEVLCNENAVYASDHLKSLMDEHGYKLTNVVYTNTTIDRQALSKVEGGKEIALVEPYYSWIIEKNEFNQQAKNILKNVTYVNNIDEYIERKLAIVNAAHACTAYLGVKIGYQTVQEVLADKTCYQYIYNMLKEHNEYLSVKYGCSNLDEYIFATLKRHANPLMADSVYRVGRNPIRKLQVNERLVAPIFANVGTIENSLKSVALCLCFDDPADQEVEEIKQMIHSFGLEATISKLTGLNAELSQQIAEHKKQLDKLQTYTEVIDYVI